MAFRSVRFAFAACLLLLVSYSSHGQSDFREGFIVKPNRDTIFGFVAYRESDRSYKICDFKTEKDGNISSYRPAELSGYGYTGDKYYEAKGDSLFFELLVTGRLALYKYQRNFWVQKNGQEFYALKNQVTEVYRNGVRYERSSKEYLGILSMLSENCPGLRQSLKNVRVSEKSLTEFVELNNQCAGTGVQVFKDKKPWSKVMAGISIGTANSHLQFTSEFSYYDFLTEPSPSTNSLMLGVNAEIFSPRLSERFSFVPALFYLSSTYKLYTELSAQAYTERNYVTISMKQLKVPFGVRYTFKERTLTPFVELGASYTLHAKSSQQWIQELKTVNVQTIEYGDSFKFKSSQLGAWGGIGVLANVSKKFSTVVQFRYEVTNGVVTDNQGLESTITNYQLILGIRTR